MTKILMADDDQDLLEIMAIHIKQHGEGKGMIHKIDTANDGQEAIDFLRRSVPEGIYDVVLTDYEMGVGPDGVDVIEEGVRLGIGRVFIVTGVSPEIGADKKKLSPLQIRLLEAVTKNNQVVHILKGNIDQYDEKVLGFLDRFNSAQK